jgi:YfiH family protein
VPFTKIAGTPVLTFDGLNRYDGITSFVTTRIGGVSGEPFTSLNLGLASGDDRDSVLENRSRVAGLVSVTGAELNTPSQVHGSRVVAVDSRNSGGIFEATDALITNIPETPIMVLTADCVAVVFFDPVKKVAGVAHAGWRGTLANIVGVTLDAMKQEFGTAPDDVVAAVGPSIGPCCYTVGPEVVDEFYAAHADIADELFANPDFASAGSFDGDVNRDVKLMDLWSANRLMLTAAGVRPSNIEVAECCTACDTKHFYSHRGESGKTGRFGALIMLRR